MDDVIADLKKTVPDEATRESVYKVLIRCFRDWDCDTLEECEGKDSAFDAAMHPRRKRRGG